MSGIDKIMQSIQPRHPHFSIRSTVFPDSLYVALWAGLLMMRSECRLGDRQSYCRCSKWPPQPARQAGSRVLCEIVGMFLWQLFRVGLQQLSTHRSSSASSGVYSTYTVWRPRRDSPMDLKVWCHSFFSVKKVEFICSQFCVARTCAVKPGLFWLKLFRFASFRYTSTKLSGKVCVLLFNGQAKCHPKMYTYYWNIDKSRMGTFLTRPIDVGWRLR